MRAVLPLHLFDVYKPQVGLIHKRGWLEGVPHPLVPHLSTCDSAELGMYQRDETVQRSTVSLTPRHQQLGDLSRGKNRHCDHILAIAVLAVALFDDFSRLPCAPRDRA
jgi:hypothetical protein